MRHSALTVVTFLQSPPLQSSFAQTTPTRSEVTLETRTITSEVPLLYIALCPKANVGVLGIASATSVGRSKTDIVIVPTVDPDELLRRATNVPAEEYVRRTLYEPVKGPRTP